MATSICIAFLSFNAFFLALNIHSYVRNKSFGNILGAVMCFVGVLAFILKASKS